MPAMDATALVDLSKVRSLARSGAARTIRLRANLSLGEVAAAVGVAASTIHRWETGERAPRGDAALEYGKLLDSLMRGGSR